MINFINLFFALLKKNPKNQETTSNENNSPKPSNESSNEQPTIYIRPSIENIINKLPHHPTRKWSQRKIQNIKKIIVHHSATTATENGFKDIEQIAKYHTSPNHISPQGCPGICYSLIMDKVGNVYQTNEFTDITWHAKGSNIIGLGVCLLGGLNDQAVDERQLASLDILLKYLIATFGLTKQNVFGHRDVCSTECPGREIYDWLQSFKK
jgi:N-acetyl-anhydromuramyl-L-alanine amidase AmpD